MADSSSLALIVKKKKNVQGDGHHGGAWKVAYADFVTAMMAFFMLMWLLNATSEEQRKGIADYFNPRFPISDESAGGRSMFGGETVFSSRELSASGRGGEAEDRTGDQTAERRLQDPEEGYVAKTLYGDPHAAAHEGDDHTRRDGPPPRAGSQPATEGGPATRGDGQGAGPNEVAARNAGALGDDPDRLAGLDGELETQDVGPDGADAAARDQAMNDGRRGRLPPGEQAFVALEHAFAAWAQSAEGDDLLEHLTLKMTPAGLTIEIAETEEEPLFASASARPSAKMRELAELVAPVLQALENRVAIVGHTDSAPFARGSRIDNWDLSSLRANAARRLLTEAGFDASRVARVAGVADQEPLVADARDPRNRRIGLTLLREAPNRPDAAASGAGPSDSAADRSKPASAAAPQPSEE